MNRKFILQTWAAAVLGLPIWWAGWKVLDATVGRLL